MINGETVILDEIKLLTRDCLRALQAYLDNKDKFEFKGNTIYIKEGFKVVGTMNLEVNGQIEALPAPLVDRAKDIDEFELSDELLAKLASGE
jgi:Mg-chelatase subunit ChlI